MESNKLHEPDRFYVRKSRIDEIRDILKMPYFIFDKHKDTFLLAMVLGADLYTIDSKIDYTKDGLFLKKDLGPMDEAIINAIVSPHLENLTDLSNKNKVYEIAEIMADKGYNILLDKMKSKSPELFILEAVNEANNLFENAQNKSLFLN